MDATATLDDTQMGLLKAMHFLTSQHQRRKVKKKLYYQPAGSRAQATRCLTGKERAEVTTLVEALAVLHPRKHKESVDALMKEIAGKPIKFVPVKREHHIDYSKAYPYRSTKRGG
ncbi:hypothetical protein [Bradyrhizobium erythrophlei]|uniref:Uncharacterized protein n=1 Tax=Bradyrhizobium erythrophlei TaxID=1437360 RepID=A0A1M5PNF7_9BRAD|nr:hypothetical protein [Bradyrhizobium erythrophlei]SHH03261.1 hypothetical protein SAMN05443248_3442 [Bradyrhizobium erythrophlei]